VPNYEIALPPGAKNIRIKTSTQEIPVDWYFYRHGKDGAEVIVPLFGGDEFVGEVLEGMWKKGDDGSIQEFTAKLNGSGSLELTGRSDSGGTFRKGWISTRSKIPLLDETIIDVHLKLPSLASSDSFWFDFVISDQNNEAPDAHSNAILLRIIATTTEYEIEIYKRVSGPWIQLLTTTTISSSEGTFRIKFEENKSGHNHTHFYFHDGTGSINESSDEVSGSPFELDLLFDSGYVHFLFHNAETTNRTVSSDFVRVTYPDFKVVYDLDDDAYRGEGEELLKRAWDTSGNGNHGTVHGATWRRNGKFGKCLEFDGEDDYVEIVDSSSIQTPNEVTLVGWFYPFATNKKLYVYKGSRVVFRNYTVRILLEHDGKIYWGFCTPTKEIYWTSIFYEANKWYHFAISIRSGDIKTFVNGELDTQRTDTFEQLDVFEGYPLVLCKSQGDDYGYGLIDEVRIYNRALSESEIQTLYNGGEVTDGLVGEWKFDGGNDRGEVKVYDTMGSDDESDWQRVFDVNHQFVGDCVIENGLIRVKFQNSDSILYASYWNGEWAGPWKIMWYGHDWWENLKVESITTEEVYVTFYSPKTGYSDRKIGLRLKRGSYRLDFEFLEAQNDYPSRKLHFNNYIVDYAFHADDIVGDKALSITFQDLLDNDNFGCAFTTSELCLLIAGNNKKRDLEFDSAYRLLIHFAESDKAFLALVPFNKVSNLFKEAENATLMNGATTDTTQTDDSGDSILLDAQYEQIQFSLTDILNKLPKGRYLLFVRAKDTNQVSNDLGVEVFNSTDSRFLNEERTTATFTLTSSFAYYSVVFDLTDDESGDQVNFNAWKRTTNTNSIYVDYFLIVPIGNGESLPQDLAHNAMRTFTKRYKVYRR